MSIVSISLEMLACSIRLVAPWCQRRSCDGVMLIFWKLWPLTNDQRAAPWCWPCHGIMGPELRVRQHSLQCGEQGLVTPIMTNNNTAPGHPELWGLFIWGNIHNCGHIVAESHLTVSWQQRAARLTNFRPCFLIGFLLFEFFTTKPLLFTMIAGGILVDLKLMGWNPILLHD